MGRRQEEFPEHHTALYCFKVVEDNDSMELAEYKIFRYQDHKLNQFYTEYVFDGRIIGSNYRRDSIRNTKLDRVVNKKFFTFNPDRKRAEKAFNEYFKASYVDAAVKYNNAEQRYNLWRAKHEQ